MDHVEWDKLPRDLLRKVLIQAVSSHPEPAKRGILFRHLRLVNKAWCKETGRLLSCLRVEAGPLERIVDTLAKRFCDISTLMLRAGVHYEFHELSQLQLLTNLHTLDLSLLPDRLGGWYMIAELPFSTRLQLSKFQLQSEWNALKPLATMTSLRALVLVCCEFSDLTLFHRLIGLTCVHLLACNTPEDGSIRHLTWLKELWLDLCTNVTNEGLQCLSNLIAVTMLRIDRMPQVRDAGIVVISNLVSLKELSLKRLGKCSTDMAFQSLSTLTLLTKLELSHLDYQTSMGPPWRCLTDFSCLSELNLSGSYGVTDSVIRGLTKLSGLKKLAIHYISPVSDLTWEHLLDSLPGLELSKDEVIDIDNT